MSETKLDAETKRCLLCVRISFEDIVSKCLQLTQEPKYAYQIAEECSKIIKIIYTKNPPLLCGRNPRVIMGGLIYYCARAEAQKLTGEIVPSYIPQYLQQGNICRVLNITEPSLRRAYQLIEQNYVPLRHRR